MPLSQVLGSIHRFSPYEAAKKIPVFGLSSKRNAILATVGQAGDNNGVRHNLSTAIYTGTYVFTSRSYSLRWCSTDFGIGQVRVA